MTLQNNVLDQIPQSMEGYKSGTYEIKEVDNSYSSVLPNKPV